MMPAFPHKCLAFHGPMLYEAKTIKIWDPDAQSVRTKSSESSGEPFATKGEIPSDLPPELETKVAYYIHYKGWKSTWDEWVSEDRVLAWNEENLRTQKELKTIALAAANRRRQGAGTVAISVAPSSHNGGSGHSNASSGGGGDTHAANGEASHDHSANGQSGHADVDGDDADSVGRASPNVEHFAGTKRRESSLKEDIAHSGRANKRGRGLDLDLEKVCLSLISFFVTLFSPIDRIFPLQKKNFFFFVLCFAFFSLLTIGSNRRMITSENPKLV